MAKLADLKVTIGLSNVRNLNRQLRDVKGKFRKNFGEIAGLARSVGTAIASGVGAGLTAIIKSGAELQTLEVGFRSIMGSAKGASDMVAKLNTFTAQTPFQLEEVARSARQLLAVGTAADDINDRLGMLGDIAAASGNSISDIAAAFAKVQAKGKVELENLNQLAERGIPIFDELKKVTGDANMEFGAGAVSVTDYNQALANMAAEGGFANDAMVNLSETVEGKFSTALDNVQLALGDFAKKSGLLDTVTNILDDFTTQIQHMSMSTDDLQQSREDVYDLRQAFKVATKDNIQGLRDQVKATESYVIKLQTALGKDVVGGHLAGVRALLNDIDEAMAFGTVPDAAPAGVDDDEETLEQFKARFEAAAKVREEQERLLELTRQQVVTDEDLIASTEGLREAYGGLSGQIEEIIIDEEELFDEEAEQRIADYTTRMKELALVGQNAGAIFGFVSGAVDAAFNNIKDSSQGFHEHMKQMLESLLKKALALAAAFGAISLLTGGTAGALAAVGKKSFGSFMMGGMGLAGFATGGMVTGPTLAMVGEGSGTTLSNPEVIAPLDKLQHMMGGGNITVSGMIRGNDILISNERSLLDRNRIRGF